MSSRKTLEKELAQEERLLKFLKEIGNSNVIKAIGNVTSDNHPNEAFGCLIINQAKLVDSIRNRQKIYEVCPYCGEESALPSLSGHGMMCENNKCDVFGFSFNCI